MSTADCEKAPWIPEESFLRQNEGSIRDIFSTIAQEFPDSGVEVVLNDNLLDPSDMAREWMWRRLMGHQHGSQLGIGGKLSLGDKEGLFRPLVAQLRYGDHSFVVPQAATALVPRDKAYIMGGSTQEFTDRTLAAVGRDPRAGNVNQMFVMGGQRLRYDYPGERTVNEIYETIAKYFPGANIDGVRERSPFVRTEERKTGNSWKQAFPTEYEIGRVCTETVFFDDIDWANYPVHYIEDTKPEEVRGTDPRTGQLFLVPPREHIAAVYALKDGREVTVVNGRAVARKQGGIPRPTSDSQTREAVEISSFGIGEQLVFSVGLPFVRAAMDSLIRVLSLRGEHVARTDIATGVWLPDIETSVAIGEIISTHKADQRLRAVLAGKDPDAFELVSI
ncbi:MAG TPA: hypothetical protein VLG92_00180 [Candidatus Saccharimonadia bacterium]|nr:hypothetical protein [Candidatus Saccharimonadia bacterium]